MATGIYAFGNGSNFGYDNGTYVGTPVYDINHVSGMTALFLWSDLEPSEGVYDWTPIDNHLADAADSGAKINIQLYAGNSSPQWVLDLLPANQKLTWTFGGSTTIVSPLVWNTTYLSKWENFVTALGARYNGNSNIEYVSITGGTFKDLSTGAIIQEESDWSVLLGLGYTTVLHEGAWNSCIDYFRSAFPATNKAIGIGVLRPGDPNVVIPTNLKDRCVTNNWDDIGFFTVTANDDWYLTTTPSRNLVAIMQDAQANGHFAGVQLIASVYRERTSPEANRRIKNMSDVLAIVQDDGAEWIEVWHDDIIYPVNTPDIGNTENRLYRRALSCSAEQLAP